jgi:hypothetical protein
MRRSRIYVPAIDAGDWRELLGKPDLHWKKGRSAMEIARRWHATPSAFPPEIAGLLTTLAPHPLASARLLAALPEYRISIAGKGSDSQADVLVLADAGSGLAVIAVEGKVDEPFDMPIAQWLIVKNPANGKQRLAGLCNVLDLDPANVGGLHYQLLHRTAGAIVEARRYHARFAAMVIHSFSPAHARHPEYTLFAEALGVKGSVDPGQAVIVGDFDDVTLAIGWASGPLSP